jgi:heme/copper-type cytochrome/quinol oxidase subunit 2
VVDEELPLSGTVVGGVRVVGVAARQFEFVPGKVVVAEGETVRLEVTSMDVTHGIAIVNYDIDRKLEPGKSEAITFKADKAGRHRFHCSVFCGAGHGSMQGELIVVPPAK